MDEVLIEKILTLSESLDQKGKLEIIRKLAEMMKYDAKKADEASTDWKSLFGAWKDVDATVAQDIYESRTTSDQNLKLD